MPDIESKLSDWELVTLPCGLGHALGSMMYDYTWIAEYGSLTRGRAVYVDGGQYTQPFHSPTQ